MLEPLVSAMNVFCFLYVLFYVMFYYLPLNFIHSCYRQEKNLAVLEPLVSAMNVFCKTMSADCRGQICKLGEATALGLLYVWNNRPPAQLKVLLLE